MEKEYTEEELEKKINKFEKIKRGSIYCMAAGLLIAVFSNITNFTSYKIYKKYYDAKKTVRILEDMKKGQGPKMPYKNEKVEKVLESFIPDNLDEAIESVKQDLEEMKNSKEYKIYEKRKKQSEYVAWGGVLFSIFGASGAIASEKKIWKYVRKKLKIK